MIGALNPSYRAADKVRRILSSSYVHHPIPIPPEQKASHINAISDGREWSGNFDDFALTACHLLEQMGHPADYVEGQAPHPAGGMASLSICVLGDFAIIPYQPIIWRVETLQDLGYRIRKATPFRDIPIHILP